MGHFIVVAVARTPQESSPPTLIEIAPLHFGGLSFEERLNSITGINVSCHPDNIPEEVRFRLRNLMTHPTELWIIEDSDIQAAGTVSSMMFQQGVLSIFAHGLSYYLNYMFVNDDTSFSQVDQFIIAKALVDQWQNLPYGNFGIDTSGIGTSSVLRDREYLAHENHNVLEKLRQLGDVTDGFDFIVNPSTRELELYYPNKGTDVSGSVFLDSRNIASDQTHISVQQGDIATVGLGTGVAPQQETPDGSEPVVPYSRFVHQASLATFGRAGVAETFDAVSKQSTVDKHTENLVLPRTIPMISPGPGMIPVAGATRSDFAIGDTVTYSYDYGLGEVELQRRIVGRTMTLDSSDNETLSVELE